MVAYVAMLRGINVGSRNPIKMDSLKELFEKQGFGKVQTYIQSGNVVFHGEEDQDVEEIAAKLEAALKKRFNAEIPVLVKTSSEIDSIFKSNPFLGKANPSVDQTKLHVTFLDKDPQASGVKSLERIQAKPDQCITSGREVYLYCPNGYGRTKLTNNVIEKLLESRATTRNWNTVKKLCELSQE